MLFSHYIHILLYMFHVILPNIGNLWWKHAKALKFYHTHRLMFLRKVNIFRILDPTIMYIHYVYSWRGFNVQCEELEFVNTDYCVSNLYAVKYRYLIYYKSPSWISLYLIISSLVTLRSKYFSDAIKLISCLWPSSN